MPKKKWTIQKISQYVNSYKYTLLSNEYKNTFTKVMLRCPEDHIYTVRWDQFLGGGRCRTCADIAKRNSIEEIHNYANSRNYVCLTTSYNGQEDKLKFRCSRNHEFEIRWIDFRRGYECKFCKRDRRRINMLEKVKKDAHKRGYKCLSNKYMSDKKLKFECPVGHKFESFWSDFSRQNCPICSHLNFFGSGNPAWRGGISFEPYCPIWSKVDFKESIKIRDDYKCMNPGCRCRSDRMVIHHIDYNKKNCVEPNLITVCNSCNGVANFEREWHTAWYQSIMNKRYNFEYGGSYE